MASFQNRSSILLRPRRVTATGVVVASTLETEHGREEARVAAKREARLNREAQMAARVWGGPEERAQLAAKEKAVFDKHLEAKRLVDQHEREASQNLDNHVQDYLQQQRAAELAREAAKREYQAKLRDENFRLSEQRKVQQQQQREEQKSQEAQQVHTPANILNKFGRHAY